MMPSSTFHLNDLAPAKSAERAESGRGDSLGAVHSMDSHGAALLPYIAAGALTFAVLAWLVNR